jgi:hypothetical protein
MFRLIAGRDSDLGIHDRATLRTMTDRRIPTQMIPVLAQGGATARRNGR